MFEGTVEAVEVRTVLDQTDVHLDGADYTFRR